MRPDARPSPAIAAARSRFLQSFCHQCTQPLGCALCSRTAGELLEPVQIPPALGDSHSICPWCWALVPDLERHLRTCIFQRVGVTLRVAGWATPASQLLRRDLRTQKPRFMRVISNILAGLVKISAERTSIVVSVPMRHHSEADHWSTVVSGAAAAHGLQHASILTRTARTSTRGSVAQIRRHIVQTEYALLEGATDRILGATVVLVDDNVTTGHTMTGLAELLMSTGASSVRALALDRTVDILIQQMWPDPGDLDCLAYSPSL